MSLHEGPQRGPETRQEIAIAVGVLLLGVGLFAAEVVTDYRPAKLVGLLFLVAWLPLIALHEAGHAVAARLVGWRVGQVVVGFGKPMWRGRVGGAAVELRLFPIEGFVTNVPGDLNFPRLKHAFIYFAGPGVELLLAGVLIGVVGWDRFFTESPDGFVIAAQAVGVAALVGGVLNLIPHGGQVGGRTVPNDGLGILLCVFRPDSFYRSMVGLRYDEADGEWKEDDPADWWKRR